MGFAVIPIIFTITEDSLANVPQHLRAGSLALGATRWQTAVRIVLPTASPGIFSAIMIGFGRAVGETMIVLMATGNTPVMDWSIFNGFRALSANIAVELPEAPEGGTSLPRALPGGLPAVLLDVRASTRWPSWFACDCAKSIATYEEAVDERRTIRLAHRGGTRHLPADGGGTDRAHPVQRPRLFLAGRRSPGDVEGR